MDETNENEFFEEEQPISPDEALEKEALEAGFNDGDVEQKTMSPMVKELISWAKVIILSFICALFIVNCVIVNAVIPTGSMERTIMPGDRVIAPRWTYIFSEPQRGDIVIFRFPDDESQLFVKRIIGLPGETVEIIQGLVLIDDYEIYEPYISSNNYLSHGPFTVEPDSFFMLGDNRASSLDSREWENTFVTKDQILGRVAFRYFSTSEWWFKMVR